MTELTELQKYEFRRSLEEVRKLSGRGTELISLYVPPSRQVSDVSNYLRSEYSQSSNIKSASTRKNVQAAISSILSRLKNFKSPPENGLVFFVGHRSVGADQTDMIQFVLEPPEPVPTFIYRCDSQFFTEPIEGMLETKDKYGLIVIDRSEATVGMLHGKRIVPIKNMQSLVPSKHGRGGQSARRFERLIEIAAHEYYKKVADVANEAFLSEKELKGIRGMKERAQRLGGRLGSGRQWMPWIHQRDVLGKDLRARPARYHVQNDVDLREGLRDRFDLLQHWAVRVSDLQELLLRRKVKLLLHTRFVDVRVKNGRISECIICGKSGPEATNGMRTASS